MVAEHAKVTLDSGVVDDFSLSVGLRMEGCGEAHLDAESFVDSSKVIRLQLGATIRNSLERGAMEFPDILNE